MKNRLLLFLLGPLLAVAVLLFFQDADPVSPRPRESASRSFATEASGTPGSDSSKTDAGPAIAVEGAAASVPVAKAAPESDVLSDFRSWVGTYLSEPSEAARAEMLEEGLALAAVRMDVMETLIQEDPESAIAEALPVDVRDKLPSAIRERMERTVGGHGDLAVLGIAPDPDKPLPKQLVLRHFETDDAFYHAYVYGSYRGVRTQKDVFLHGIAVRNSFAVNDTAARVLGTREAEELTVPAAPCPPELGEHAGGEAPFVVVETRDGFQSFCCEGHWMASGLQGEKPGFHLMAHGNTYATTGVRSVLVIRVDFETPDNYDEEKGPISGESVSVDEAYATMIEVGEFLRDASFRQFEFGQINVTEGEPLRMPRTLEEYQAEGGEDPETGETTPAGNSLLLEDAIAAATEEGYTYNYDFIIVAFPGIEYPWAGLGNVGGKNSWIQDRFSPGVVAHELGHNLGLLHASYWKPLGPVSSGDYPMAPARSVEYGNSFDVMGGGSFPKNHISGNFKNILGWIPDESVGVVDTDTPAGVHRIYRLDGGADLVAGRDYSLEIVVENHRDAPEPPVRDYWVDFRQLFTESERAMNGVVVQWGDRPGGEGVSHLLNLHPEPWEKPTTDSALRVGETFVDLVNEVIITPREIGGGGSSSYIDVIVTRGRLDVEMIAPQAEFSIDNPTGETTMVAGDVAEFRARVTATGSPVGGVEFVLNGERFAGVATGDGTGVYTAKVPTSGWPDDSALEVVCIVRNEAGNEVETEPVLFRFVEPQIELVADPLTVVLGEAEDLVSLEVVPVQPDVFFGESEIFVNDVSVGMTVEQRLDWPVTEAGVFTAYAIVIDETGLPHRTPPVDLRVYDQGDRAYTFTADPVSVMLGETVFLSVDVGEEAIASVDYLVDGTLVEIVDEAPYGLEWEPTAPGAFAVRSVLFEEDGGTTPSPEQLVTVATPTLALDVSPRIAQPGESFRISVDVDAESWLVTEVEYLVNGSTYTTTGSLDEPVNFVPSIAGTHAIEVRARDKYGNEAVAATGNVATYAILNLDWTEPRLISFSFTDLFGGAAGNGRIVLGGGVDSDGGAGEGRVYSSDDGTVWAEAVLPTSFVVRGLAYGNGLFVAVGNAGHIATSADGRSWDTAVSGLNSHLRDVTFADGRFVAVGDQGVILHSVDGVRWDRAESPETNNTLWQSAYGNGRWLAVGQAGMILTSADGSVWTAQPSLTTIALRGVTFGKGAFVAVGGRTPAPGETEGVILTSVDGDAWTVTEREEMLTSILFAEYAFVATGTNGTILSSYDRVNWGSPPGAGSATLNGTVFQDGLLVAYGERGFIRTARLPENATTYPDWLAIHLSAAQIDDFASILPEASVQGSIPNIVRYAFGFDPWTPIPPEEMPRLVRVPGESGDHFGLTYRLSTSASDITVIPETSTNLLDWTPLDPAEADSVDHGDFEVWTIDDALEPESDRRFFRLNIQLPW